jgi:hypothetical protein
VAPAEVLIRKAVNEGLGRRRRFQMPRRGPSFNEAEVSSRGSRLGEANLPVLGPIQRLGPVADRERRPTERGWWIEKTPGVPLVVPHVHSRNVSAPSRGFFVKELDID